MAVDIVASIIDVALLSMASSNLAETIMSVTVISAGEKGDAGAETQSFSRMLSQGMGMVVTKSNYGYERLISQNV